MKILTFYIAEKKYGISIEHIVTIEKNDRKITDIPQSDPAIRGVVNIRSNICPVIDLKVILDNEKNELDESKKLILFKWNEKNGALLVDDTDNIIDVEENEIESFEYDDKATKVVNTNGEIFVLIELEEFDKFLQK